MSGKKTYLVAAVSALYAILGLALGHLTYDQALQILQISGVAAALRTAIAKMQKN